MERQLIDNFNPRKIKSVKREVTLRIEKYANDGVSIAYENDKVIFVRYAIPGELVRINIYKETKDYAMGEPVEIIEKSKDRIDAPCKYFGLCGGCDYQMLSYEKQIEIKKMLVSETFLKIGKIDISKMLEVIESPLKLNYRNTETFKVYEKLKKIGFFRKDTKSIVDIDKCMLAMEGINTAMNDVRNQENFPPHNFKVRTTLENDTVVNMIKTDKYEDREVYETIEAQGKKLKYKISKDSFFQTNDYVIPLWIEKIISFLDEEHKERIFDLYCGIGLITLFVSFFAKETIGVEIQKSSVADAKLNVEINKIDSNIKFVLAPVEETLAELGKADVMIIDPPRRGMDKEALDTLMKLAPKKIIYSSCKPATMARDISILSEKYELTNMVLVDMFPQTHHCEMLSLLKIKEE
jgi:23S rRNA (uracil1939-C5)-methyltransferase